MGSLSATGLACTELPTTFPVFCSFHLILPPCRVGGQGWQLDGEGAIQVGIFTSKQVEFIVHLSLGRHTYDTSVPLTTQGGDGIVQVGPKLG
eukprot:1975011-Amphidinium_carterae.1